MDSCYLFPINVMYQNSSRPLLQIQRISFAFLLLTIIANQKFDHPCTPLSDTAMDQSSGCSLMILYANFWCFVTLILPAMQSLRSVLNAFCVVNRKNMFVYQERTTKSVFYLRWVTVSQFLQINNWLVVVFQWMRLILQIKQESTLLPIPRSEVWFTPRECMKLT